MAPQKQQSNSEKSNEIRGLISHYHKKISQLRMEISDLQDLISDLLSDLSMLEMKEGKTGGNKKEEE